MTTLSMAMPTVTCVLTMDALTVAKLTMAQVYRQTTQRDLRQELKSGTGGKLGKLVRPLRPTLTLTLRNNNPITLTL